MVDGETEANCANDPPWITNTMSAKNAPHMLNTKENIRAFPDLIPKTRIMMSWIAKRMMANVANSNQFMWTSRILRPYGAI